MAEGATKAVTWWEMASRSQVARSELPTPTCSGRSLEPSCGGAGREVSGIGPGAAGHCWVCSEERLLPGSSLQQKMAAEAAGPAEMQLVGNTLSPASRFSPQMPLESGSVQDALVCLQSPALKANASGNNPLKDSGHFRFQVSLTPGDWRSSTCWVERADQNPGCHGKALHSLRTLTPQEA